MKIDIVTLFPEIFTPFKEWSMIKKAREINALDLNVHDLRQWAIDKHGTVDSRPYGGGPGMILRPEPIFNSLSELKLKAKSSNLKAILLSAKGQTFNQKTAQKLSKLDQAILICGHYEGVDERVRQKMIDIDISIGDYVLSGGEIPAMVVTDAISRLLPNVLEKEGAAEEESFSPGLTKLLPESSKLKAESLIEFPQYTRPEDFNGWKVPDILLSGDHQKITQWRAEQITIKND